jgi:hypothetical protein
MECRIILIIIGIVYTNTLLAQTVIRTGSDVSAKGTISTNGSIINNSDKTDLKEAQLNLIGVNQTLSTATPLTLKSLIINGGGTKTTKGDLTITEAFTLTNGIVSPGTGKLLYIGANTLAGNPSSYVSGTLYQRGTGVRAFPIGVGSAYMPMSLNNIEDGNAEIGVTGFTSAANLSLPADINSIARNRTWQVGVTGGSLRATSASLYVPGSSIDASQRLIVVEADDANGATAINLGGGITGDFVTSFSPATKSILTIGITENLEMRILDLITPFNSDNINDKLKIVNIEYTYENKVTLLDRWGVPVREWKNFRNYDDPNIPNTDSFDFTRLSPGNYICVLEYKLSADAPVAKMNQMISVLKGN